MRPTFLQRLCGRALCTVVCLCLVTRPGWAQGDSPDGGAAELVAAWQSFQSGHFARAEKQYRQALAQGESSGDAELGLAWSLQRLGRCAEARPHFLAMQRQRPGDPGVEQGLALCPPPPPLRFFPALRQGVYIYSNHPTRQVALATTARLAAQIYDRWLLSVAYRFSYFSTPLASSQPWLQHDVYAAAGYDERRFGVSLQYGMLRGALAAPLPISATATADYAETSHHFGASARYSPFGDGQASVVVSLYPTDTLVRGELSWWLPITHGLRVRPGAALQYSGGALRPSGALTIGYEHPLAGAFLGGKYGPELRPAQLVYEFVYNGPERILYGLWAGVSVRPGARFSLVLSYAYDRMAVDGQDLTTGATTTTFSDVHYLTLSVSKEL
jgi:hypothetical protein